VYRIEWIKEKSPFVISLIKTMKKIRGGSLLKKVTWNLIPVKLNSVWSASFIGWLHSSYGIIWSVT